MSRQEQSGRDTQAPVLFLAWLTIEMGRYQRYWILGLPEYLPRKYEVCFLAPIFGVQSAVSKEGCVRMLRWDSEMGPRAIQIPAKSRAHVRRMVAQQILVFQSNFNKI